MWSSVLTGPPVPPRYKLRLRPAGIEVSTFPANEIAKNNSGPHCLTMPLVRAD